MVRACRSIACAGYKEATVERAGSICHSLPLLNEVCWETIPPLHPPNLCKVDHITCPMARVAVEIQRHEALVIRHHESACHDVAVTGSLHLKIGEWMQ